MDKTSIEKGPLPDMERGPRQEVPVGVRTIRYALPEAGTSRNGGVPHATKNNITQNVMTVKGFDRGKKMAYASLYYV